MIQEALVLCDMLLQVPSHLEFLIVLEPLWPLFSLRLSLGMTTVVDQQDTSFRQLLDHWVLGAFLLDSTALSCALNPASHILLPFGILLSSHNFVQPRWTPVWCALKSRMIYAADVPILCRVQLTTSYVT